MSIEWEKEVTLADNVECILGFDGQQWYCASQSGPRYCFVGGSRQDAIATAERAMKFYGDYERKQENENGN